MIKHIVMWKFKPENEMRNKAAMEAMLLNMRNKVDGLMALEVGHDISSAPSSCDLVLYSEFETEQALQAYQDHPDHQAIKREVSDWITFRAVVDYEC